MISAETRRGGASVAAIDSQESLVNFIETHFVVESHQRYARYLDIAFNKTPFRAQNPSYLKFLGRSLLIAAEYGRPEAGGHFYQARVRGVEDPLDPRWVLWMTTTIAKGTLAQMEHKLQLIDHLKRIGHPDAKNQFYLILGINDTREFLSEENRQPMEEFSPRGKRDNPNQPLFLPDMDKLRRMAAINFGQGDLNIDKNRFTQEKLEPTRIAFPEIDVDQIFFHPQETWAPIVDPNIRIKS